MRIFAHTHKQQIEEAPEMALEMLATVLESSELMADNSLAESPKSMANDSSAGEVDLLAAAYLLSAITNVLGNDVVEPVVSEVRWTL